MDLFELETFLAVIREGSFSAAARVVHRTQPAVSQIVRRLEGEVGQPLFDRSSRRGVLTDAGRELQRHAERLLNLHRQAIVALDDLRQLKTGRLTVAANEMTCLYLLPVVSEFRRLHPAVHVTIERALASRIPTAVSDYGADLGIVTYEPDDPALRSIVVYRDELVFVVPPSHALAGQRRVSIRRLAGEAFIAHHVASPYRRRVIETFHRRHVTLQMPVEMPTIEAIKRFVAMGHGVALLPGISVEAELARGELVRVPVPELAFERSLRLVHVRKATLSHATRAFLGVVERRAARERGRHLFKVER
ncbi:MAG: LysR family transcriptional regulator [Acidobacteriota bacterium]